MPLESQKEKEDRLDYIGRTKYRGAERCSMCVYVLARASAGEARETHSRIENRIDENDMMDYAPSLTRKERRRRKLGEASRKGKGWNIWQRKCLRS